MKLRLANPRGFCAGVDRAIDIVERAITLFGAPIYVRHEVVHNRHVVERLRTMGAVFVGSQNGTVYALDKESGCVRWTFRASAEVRSPVTPSRPTE